MRPPIQESLHTLTKSMHTCAICWRHDCLLPSGTDLWIHGWTRLVMLLFQRWRWIARSGWAMPGTSEHCNASFSLLVCNARWDTLRCRQDHRRKLRLAAISWAAFCLLAKNICPPTPPACLTPVIHADVHNRQWQLLEGTLRCKYPAVVLDRLSVWHTQAQTTKSNISQTIIIVE